MSDILIWPHKLLVPAKTEISVAPFSRGGGRTLGGISRTRRTDRGYWSIMLENVSLHGPGRRRTWDAIGTALSGRPGLIVVPAWSFDTTPFINGQRASSPSVPHSDGSSFNDGSLYRGSSVVVTCAADAAIGDTSIQLEIINAEPDLAGVRFSYQYALYKTGRVLSADGDACTVELATTIRTPIPAGAALEFDEPTCLCHLADDRAMDIGLDSNGMDQRSVSFVEATDFWSDLAAGLI